MTIIGIDDTDSRTYGMCTTYVGHRIAEELKQRGFSVESTLLIRLNPAAKHKTRGNAAVAVHTDAPEEVARRIGKEQVFPNARVEDDDTNPALLVYDDDIPDKVANFTNRAIRELLDIQEAVNLIKEFGISQDYRGNGRGRIGALAAIGAKKSNNDWTHEYISYRMESEWGSDREFDYDSLFEAADKYYSGAWDTVDTVQGDAVAVPRTPCPIMYAIRGDSVEDIKDLSCEIKSEEIRSRQLFMTNQGTDSHLRKSTIEESENDKAYSIEGAVVSEPETRKGGHVFFTLSDDTDEIDVVAFEPTKHFRDKVRDLRVGDELVVCGEIKNETLKLEKFALVSGNNTKFVNPTCPSCGNSMKSAGSDAGYRCRDCSTSQDEKEEVPINRRLERGWHEVPPCARRHIAKPLIRGGFDLPTHPYR